MIRRRGAEGGKSKKGDKQTMTPQQWDRLTPSQRLNVLCQLWSALDLTGQTVLLRLAWAMVSSLDNETVAAIGRMVGLVANDNESPEANTLTC